MCLTNVPENRVPFAKPAGYDPASTSCLLRVLDAGWRDSFEKFDPIPNHKTDTNNHGPFSTDNIGMNYDYPEASYERRREILARARAVPAGVDVLPGQRPAGAGGRPQADEPVGPGEGRIHGQRQLAAPDLRPRSAADGRPLCDDRARLHTAASRRPTRSAWARTPWIRTTCSVTSTPEGHVQNEGDVGVSTPRPVQDRLRVARPEAGRVREPAGAGLRQHSHIAFGSIRMEPVFMILGQSAATAAGLAIDAGLTVQDVPYADLRKHLLDDGQVLEWTRAALADDRAVQSSTLGGAVVDDSRAKFVGDWSASANSGKMGRCRIPARW